MSVWVMEEEEEKRVLWTRDPGAWVRSGHNWDDASVCLSVYVYVCLSLYLFSLVWRVESSVDSRYMYLCACT